MMAFIKSDTAAVLEKEALVYGVSAAAMARAIVTTVVSEKLTHTILAGVDVKAMEPRGRQTKYERYDFMGGRYSVDEIASMTGIPASTLRNRIKRGMSAEMAVARKDMRRTA